MEGDPLPKLERGCDSDQCAMRIHSDRLARIGGTSTLHLDMNVGWDARAAALCGTLLLGKKFSDGTCHNPGVVGEGNRLTGKGIDTNSLFEGWKHDVAAAQLECNGGLS